VATKRAKKRKRREARGVDANEVRRQRLEVRRQARAEAVEKQRRAERRTKIIRRTIAILLLAGLVWFVLFRNQRPTEIAGHQLDLFSEGRGTPTHVSGTVSYPMTPPVSGQHAPTPIDCGTYAEQPPNENMVHALEHGAIGLLYDPATASIDDIRTLEQIAHDSDSHIFSAPYSGMETTFSIISWGEMMRLDELDVPAVNEYIDMFIRKAPESIDCPNSQTDTFQPPPAEGAGRGDNGGGGENAGNNGGANNGGANSGGGNNGGG
jgi:uncharacterized membrane protein YgcG